MKDSRQNLIKRFLCAKTNTKFLNQENKLYSLFLHEDLYPVIYQNDNGSFLKSESKLRKRNIKKSLTGNFLSIKYIILLLRSNKFSESKRSFFSSRRFREQKKEQVSLSSKNPFRQLKKNSVSHLILESITFVLLCSQQKKSAVEKIFLRKKHIFISIHKPLEYIEKQWQYDSFRFQGRFCRFFHPEVLIRILRKKIQDISFLHLLRRLLYSDKCISENKELPYFNIRNILWNIYILEIDNFFLSDCKNYSISDKWTYTTSNQSLSCLQKMKDWTDFFEKEESNNYFEVKRKKNSFSFLLLAPVKQIGNSKSNLDNELERKREISFLVQSTTYKYFRAKRNWFLFFQKEKSWNFLIKRRVLQFFVRRLGYVFQEKTKKPSFLFLGYQRKISSYFFLAYILHFTRRKNLVRINTKFFFLMNYFVKRIVSFLTPLYCIILILSKQNFCNSVGYPKSKSGWVTWTDSEIIQHFARIRNSLVLFYSGCNNSKALSRLQFILHFSCAKTLACKHKTNLRHIFKKFGKNLTMKNFPKTPSLCLITDQSKNSKLRSFYKNQKFSRVWNFQLTQMDSIIFHLEDFEKMVK